MSYISVSELFGQDALATVIIDAGTFSIDAPHPADDVIQRMCEDLMRGADFDLTPSKLWAGFTLMVDETSGTTGGMWSGEPSWLIVTGATFDPLDGRLVVAGNIYEMVER